MPTFPLGEPPEGDCGAILDVWDEIIRGVGLSRMYSLPTSRTPYKHAGQIVTTSTVFIVDPAGGYGICVA